jgi:hypothetical protein
MRFTAESATAIVTAVSSGVAMTAQGVMDATQGVALAPSVLLSLLSGVAAGGVSYGLLKGKVDNARDRAEESHDRHDKTDAKIDKILESVSQTREMVATLVGEAKASERDRRDRRREDARE